jgi:hypothetical protein
MELSELIEKYHEIKEELSFLEAERTELEKPYVQALQTIENECLARLQAQGLQNAKTPAGTAYLATQTRVSVRDKGEFFRYMQGSGDYSMLDIRALKEPVKEFVKENGANPPGVEVSHWVECNIRKS